MLTSGGEPLQLTHDEDKIVENFSADGTEIYYRRNLGRDEVWAVPTLGGSPHRVVSGHTLVSSPDGNSLFYLKTDAPQAIFRAGKSGLNEETVFSFDGPSRTATSILPCPDGESLLVTSFQTSPNEFRFHRVNLPSRKATDLGAAFGIPVIPAWAEPGKSVLFSRDVNGLTNLWKLELANQALTQVTFGPGPDYSPLPDPSSKGIYYKLVRSLGLFLVGVRQKSRATFRKVGVRSEARIYYVNGKQSGFLTFYHPPGNPWTSPPKTVRNPRFRRTARESCTSNLPDLTSQGLRP
jgi:hypothetical protein